MARNWFFVCGGLFFLVASLAVARFTLDWGHVVAGVQPVAGGEGVVVVTHNGETYLMRFGTAFVGVGNIHDGDIKGVSR